MTTQNSYISYNDPRVEPSVPDEEAKVKELLSVIERVSRRHFSAHRHGHRVTHVKTQAIVKGTLSIPDNLLHHLAQGLFAPANAGSHPVAVRYANEPIFIQDDRTPGPRGCGMKVFDVHGDFLDPAGAQSRTQDMTFNNAPMLELRDLPTTLEIFKLREKYYDRPAEELKEELEKRPDAET